MSSESSIPSLTSLDFVPFLDPEGQLVDQFDGQVGVYAIFNQEQTLQFIGFSRDVSLSLKQHLVRQPHHCHWVKVQTSDRPNRTMLEAIRTAWIAENGVVPSGNSTDEAAWTQPINAKTSMTAVETAQFSATDEMGQMKLLKQVARRVEAQILSALQDRGVQMQIRFNPKLKESGLLDLK